MAHNRVVVAVAVKNGLLALHRVHAPLLAVLRVRNHVRAHPVRPPAAALCGNASNLVHAAKINLDPLATSIVVRNPASPGAAAKQTRMTRAIVVPVVAVRARRGERRVRNVHVAKTKRLAKTVLRALRSIDLPAQRRPAVGERIDNQTHIARLEVSELQLDNRVVVVVTSEHLRVVLNAVVLPALAVIAVRKRVRGHPVAAVGAALCRNAAHINNLAQINLDPLAGAVVVRNPATPVRRAIETRPLRAVVAPVVAVGGAGRERGVRDGVARETEGLARRLGVVLGRVELEAPAGPALELVGVHADVARLEGAGEDVRDDGVFVPVAAELLALAGAAVGVPSPVVLVVGRVLDEEVAHPVRASAAALEGNTADGADAAEIDLDPLVSGVVVRDEAAVVVAAEQTGVSRAIVLVPAVDCGCRESRVWDLTALHSECSAELVCRGACGKQNVL
eukprot:comp21711_c0_seq3/m.48338 comp21711_c0_seq3/g.48338  ORF comp21711_c0_seq3/g.48338 comp21711_c0_seq3/m.48338 type:complete len:450 (+) comp21711_c0_seq3:1017-2366(+)